jgi:hypothetical protein
MMHGASPLSRLSLSLSNDREVVPRVQSVNSRSDLEGPCLERPWSRVREASPLCPSPASQECGYGRELRELRTGERQEFVSKTSGQNVRLDKGLASQDYPVAEVFYLA